MNTNRLKPKWYQFPNGVSVWDIARWLNFNCGNIVKYVCRAGRKTEMGMEDIDKQIEDLMKAKEYIEDEIARVQQIKFESRTIPEE